MNIKYNKDIKIYENNNKFKVYKKYDVKDKSLVLKSFLKSINIKYKSLISEKEIIDLMKVSLTIVNL